MFFIRFLVFLVGTSVCPIANAIFTQNECDSDDIICWFFFCLSLSSLLLYIYILFQYRDICFNLIFFLIFFIQVYRFSVILVLSPSIPSFVYPKTRYRACSRDKMARDCHLYCYVFLVTFSHI